MTNTIPSVPRELLDRVKSLCEYWFVRGQQQHMSESEHKTWHALGFGSSAFTELRTLLSTPSPAGVDGCKGKNCGATDGVSHSDECIAEHEQACGCADLNGLPVVAYLIGGEPSLTLCPVCGVVNEPLCRLSAAQAIIDGLRGEVADLYTTMMAAAVEIQEQWAAHCDEDGYGPANLIYRLERGIASQYGYNAETLVRLEAKRDHLAQRIGELEAALEFACKALAQVTSSDGSGHADIAVSVLRMAGTKDADALHVVETYKAGAKWRIDAALSAGKEGDQ